jgi:hypothetical protein
MIPVFHNTMVMGLFIVCACEFTYFLFLIKLFNNKAGRQRVNRPVGPLDSMLT